MSYVANSLPKNLLLTTAVTTVGVLSYSASAKAMNDWTGFTYDDPSSVTVTTPDVNTTNIQTNNFLTKATGDADLKAGHHAIVDARYGDDAIFAVYDTEADPTRILGDLTSNANIFIFDSNGVIFGANSQVNVGSIVATTGTIADADLLDGDGRFEITNVAPGSEIILKGNITVAEAGLAGFVAPTVKNSGIIKAKMGHVAMAAGEKVTLDLYGDNLVEIAVDDELADGLLQNTGEIKAAGGEVVISARVAKAAVDNVINMSGVVDVTSAKVQGGKIVLSGGSKGRVRVAGNIKANGKKGQKAGSIDVAGQNILVTAAAEVKAKGKNGGDAGDIKVVADDTLTVNGLIHATGAAGTGFIETSAPTTTFGGGVSILANREWLLDPTDVLVDATLEGLIETQLGVGDMTVQTPAAGAGAGDIDVDVVIDWSTANTFKLLAHGDVNINGTGGINATGAGSFEANAGDDVQVNGDISTMGGDVTLIAGVDANQDDVNIDADIATNGGNFSATAADDIHVRADLTTGGGHVVLTTFDNANVSNVSVTSVGSIVTDNGNVTINSDDIFLSTSGGLTKINAGTGEVSIRRVSDGLINLGSGAGGTSLTAGELAAISAATLNIGNDDSTASNVSEIAVTDVDLSGIATVNLNALVDPTSTIDFSGTNNFAALNADANVVNVLDGAVNATTSIFFDAPTVNLNGDLDAPSITGTASTVNVQSDSAQIQDGVDVAAINAMINVAAGTFTESVNVNKTVTLSGANAGTAGNGVRVAESIITSSGNGLTITANNVVVDGFKMMNNAQSGVHLDTNSDGSIVRNNIIDGTGAAGVLADASTASLVIRDNKLDNTKTAISLDGASNSIVRLNDIGLTGGANNIDGNGVSVANASGVRLIDNNIQNTTASGVLANGNTDTVMRDNDIDFTGGDGIAINSSNNARALNNKVQNTVGNGISSDTSDNLVIADNKINNIADDAIDLDGVTNSVLRDNKIGTQAGIDNIAEDGIDIAGGSNIRLLRNRIKNVVENGVEAFQSDDLVLRENVIRDIGENGVDVEEGNKATFIDNTITDTGEDGLKTFKTDEVIARENTIRRTGRDGMDIRRADRAVIVTNTITDTARRGILARRINGTADPALIIRDNTVKDTRRNAIVADNFTDALVVDNTVRDSRRSGIVIHDGDSVDARRNDIRDVNRDGFFIEDVETVDLINNDVRRAGDDGAHIADFDTALVERNDIRETGDDGLEAVDGDKVSIINNFLRKIGFVSTGANADFAGADAISIENVSGDDAVNQFSVDVQENDIKRTYDDAIDAAFVGRTRINNNEIKHVGGDNSGDFGGGDIFGADGIFVLGAIDSKTGNRFDLKINKNTIDKTADDAIQSLLSGDTQVRRNTITNVGTPAGEGFTGADGINIITGFDVFGRGRPGPADVKVSIVKNDISDALDDGVEVWGASDLTVDMNTIDGSGDDGINILGFNSSNGVTLLPSYDAVVSNNTVTNSGTDGIQSEGFTNALIDTNTVSDSAEIGINISGFNNGTTEVSGNTLTDNDIGLQFESGVADLTGPGNTFENGRVGIRFAPYDLSQPNLSSFIFGTGTGFADLSLIDDDGAGGFGGTIGAQTFDSQTASYVELDNGAFFAPGSPTLLNALDSTYLNTPFGDVTPSVDFLPDGFTAEQIAFFESMFVHFIDDGSLGLFFFPPDIDQERIFNQFDPISAGIAGLNVTILGLPNLPGNVGAALNNITTFAGNEDGTDELAGLTPEQLNNIETAAGGEAVTCWSDALNQAENGIASDMSFAGSAEDLLTAEASCSL